MLFHFTVVHDLWRVLNLYVQVSYCLWGIRSKALYWSMKWRRLRSFELIFWGISAPWTATYTHFSGGPSGGAAITLLHVEASKDVCVASIMLPCFHCFRFDTTTTTISTQSQRIIDNCSHVTLLADFPQDSRCALRTNFTAQSSKARGQRESAGGCCSYEWCWQC